MAPVGLRGGAGEAVSIQKHRKISLDVYHPSNRGCLEALTYPSYSEVGSYRQ
jgi:hypothetical protein